MTSARPRDKETWPHFDGRFRGAASLVRAQRHDRDTAPTEGGPRWPLSVILKPSPDSEVSASLDKLTVLAAELAGEQHWHTGITGSAHLTVRALENYRHTINQDDPALVRYTAALHGTSDRIEPVSFEVTGLVLTSRTVMACAHPTDNNADRLQEVLVGELGDDAWREGIGNRRDLWYLNVLHFIGDIDHPDALVEWVDACHDTPLGTCTVEHLTLAQFRQMAAPQPRMQSRTLAQQALTLSSHR